MAGAFDDLVTPSAGAASKGAFDDLVPASVSAGKALNANINSVPRQLGLTARYGLEGLANAAQVVTEPLRYATDRLTGMTGRTEPLGALATRLADAVGLPAPETANERVIGDAAKLVAGAGGLGGAAQLGARLPGMAGTMMSGLAANPTAQLTSAAGAGLAGGASREGGGGVGTQAAAALLGGVAGGMVPGAASAVGGLLRRTVTPAMTPQQLDVQIGTIMERAGADYSQVPENARRALRVELKTALQAGKEVDPQAVRRLADFAAVGATPTRGMVSQNPVQITREQNLAKMAANSSDDQLHGLPLIQNQNNRTLISRMNDLGGRSEVDALTAGQRLADAIGDTRDRMRGVEQDLWREAKSSPGYKQAIYPDGLNAALRETGDEALTGYLPKQITDYMAAFQTGQQPFTPQHYKNLRSMLSAETAKGGNEAAAAKAAIRGLESVEMKPITNPGGIDFGTAPVTPGVAAAMRNFDGQAQTSIDAVNRARAATRQAYAWEESSPLVKVALSDARTADPEKLAQSFVINGTLRDARSVAQELGPQGLPVIRDAIATHIKKQALSGSADETGKVSQSALNAALNKIGNEKLSVFFSPEEIQQFRTLGRVASLIQAQPVGSAVNNSNSGALLLGRGMDMLNKLPVVGPLAGPAIKNIGISLAQRQAQNVLPGLLAPVERPAMTPALLLPGLAAGGGLLSAP